MLKSPNAFYQDCRFTLYSQAEDKKILKRSDFNSDILYGYTALQQSDFRWLLILCLTVPMRIVVYMEHRMTVCTCIEDHHALIGNPACSATLDLHHNDVRCGFHMLHEI